MDSVVLGGHLEPTTISHIVVRCPPQFCFGKMQQINPNEPVIEDSYPFRKKGDGVVSDLLMAISGDCPATSALLFPPLPFLV